LKEFQVESRRDLPAFGLSTFSPTATRAGPRHSIDLVPADLGIDRRNSTTGRNLCIPLCMTEINTHMFIYLTVRRFKSHLELVQVWRRTSQTGPLMDSTNTYAASAEQIDLCLLGIIQIGIYGRVQLRSRQEDLSVPAFQTHTF
jgi:hypothetical protein